MNIIIAGRMVPAKCRAYDTFPVRFKNFGGEYAAQSDKTVQYLTTGITGNCFGEAAFMTGLERNADVVVMAS